MAWCLRRQRDQASWWLLPRVTLTWRLNRRRISAVVSGTRSSPLLSVMSSGGLYALGGANRCPQAEVPLFSGGAGQPGRPGAGPAGAGGCGKKGVGEHRQGDVPVPGAPFADLVVVEPGLVLRVGDRLRGFDRLPAEVELTNPRHPLAGQRVPVVSAFRRRGDGWLVVMLPDGFPAVVPVDDTDLGGPCVAGTGATVLSVAGVRRLRELAAAVSAKGRDR
jgi:hypothetical protein